MKWLHVVKDSVEAAAPPNALKAIVAPGYVVCLFPKVGEVRGLIHLGPNTMQSTGAPAAVVAQIDEVSRRFERLGGSLDGGRAEIVGGADVTKIADEHRRRQNAARSVDIITEALAARRIVVSRTRVGGVKGRVVELRLPCSSAEINFVSKDRRPNHHRSQCLPSTLDPIVVHRVDEQVVNMGCIRVGRPPTRLVAVLGSCVGVALYDEVLNLGALAHVMMPEADRINGTPGKYANTAIPALIERLSAEGAKVRNLRAKLAGGANVLFQGSGTLTQLGMRNVEATREALRAHNIPVDWEDVGGRVGRKILVDLERFRFVVKLLDLREAPR